MLSEKELYDQGVLWFKANKIDIAKKYWDEAAIKGNASAMFCLGIYFLSDQYYDKERAEFWFKRAEILGHKNASYQLKLLNENVSERRMIANYYFTKNQSQSSLDDTEFKIKKFGNYEWFVIYDEKDRQLLLSKDIIEIRPYHDVDECVCWENSKIRQWLNKEFLKSFDEKYQRNILKVEQQNKSNPQYNINGGRNTKDKCFLLSYEELKKYMNIDITKRNNNDLLNIKNNNIKLKAVVNLSKKTLYELKNRTKLDYSMVNGQQIGWWLRTPGSQGNRAMRINCNGAVRLHGREVTGRLVGVRPALWVKK